MNYEHTKQYETLTVEQFYATDGDSWWSVLVWENGIADLATGVMHPAREAAEFEMAALQRPQPDRAPYVL